MMNPIVYALAETPMKDTIGETFGERAGVAGSVTLLGMVTIFAVLAILWGVIEVLHRVLNRGGKTDTPAAKPATPAAKPAAEAKKPAQATQAVKATETARRDDGELVAVITAERWTPMPTQRRSCSDVPLWRSSTPILPTGSGCGARRRGGA